MTIEEWFNNLPYDLITGIGQDIISGFAGGYLHSLLKN